MNDLSIEKTMTIKEIAEALKVSRQLVSEKAKELFPEKIKNGIATRLNEKEVTEIKKKIELNPMLPSMTVEGMAKTDLEMQKITIDVIAYWTRKANELKEQLKQKENQVNRLIHDKKTYTSTEIAKELNLRSGAELNKMLAEKDIQYKLNNTWILTAEYSDKDYVSIKQQELDNGKIIYNRHWTGKGRDFILCLMSYKK